MCPHSMRGLREASHTQHARATSRSPRVSWVSAPTRTPASPASRSLRPRRRRGSQRRGGDEPDGPEHREELNRAVVRVVGEVEAGGEAVVGEVGGVGVQAPGPTAPVSRNESPPSGSRAGAAPRGPRAGGGTPSRPRPRRATRPRVRRAPPRASPRAGRRRRAPGSERTRAIAAAKPSARRPPPPRAAGGAEWRARGGGRSRRAPRRRQSPARRPTPPRPWPPRAPPSPRAGSSRAPAGRGAARGATRGRGPRARCRSRASRASTPAPSRRPARPVAREELAPARRGERRRERDRGRHLVGPRRERQRGEDQHEGACGGRYQRPSQNAAPWVWPWAVRRSSSRWAARRLSTRRSPSSAMPSQPALSRRASASWAKTRTTSTWSCSWPRRRACHASHSATSAEWPRPASAAREVHGHGGNHGRGGDLAARPARDPGPWRFHVVSDATGTPASSRGQRAMHDSSSAMRSAPSRSTTRRRRRRAGAGVAAGLGPVDAGEEEQRHLPSVVAGARGGGNERVGAFRRGTRDL